MKYITQAKRLSALLLALSMLLVACSTDQSTQLFAAPEVGEVTFDGDTITITGANFIQVQDGNTLPTNLTISVCGELLGNLVLNGETKTVVLAPGSIATITTATKIIGTLTGIFVGEHDGIRITNPDGQTINIDMDCKGEIDEPYADPNIFQVTIDFNAGIEDSSSYEPQQLGPEDYTVFFLPLGGEGTIIIDWGDGTGPSSVTDPIPFGSNRSTGLIHEYAESGEYIVKVTGLLANATFGTYSYEYTPASAFPYTFSGDNRFEEMEALKSVDSWGSFQWEHFIGAFADNRNLVSVPNYLPPGVTNLRAMFLNARLFNSDIGAWDTSSVTDMEMMFEQASSFNQDISLWDVSAAENMDAMFYSASTFNQDLSGWCASSLAERPGAFLDYTPIGHIAAKFPSWGPDCEYSMYPYGM